MNTDLHSVEFTKRNIFLRGNYTTRSVSEVYRRLQVIDEVPFVMRLFARGVADDPGCGYNITSRSSHLIL